MLAAMGAVSGTTASISMANVCVRVEEQNTGSWTNATCTEKKAGEPKNWILIQEETLYLGSGQWCARVESGEPSLYKDPQCISKSENGGFIKVYERPTWYVSGNQLKQGTRQIKLQVKGVAILKSVVAGKALKIECKNAVSEGSTIEGNGLGQGQGKGRITFTSCASETCPPHEPIITNQTKAHLGTSTGSQSKYVELFEPTQGENFTEIKLGGACLVTVAAKGTVAAEVIPGEAEGQEGLLNFPEPPIEKVNLEGQEKKVGLKLGAEPAKFSGTFGARLETKEVFGVFGSN
jgi:hypothetical protein